MNRSHVYVFLAAFGFSFILVFSTVLKESGMSSFEQLLFRLSFGGIILLFMLLSSRRFSFVSKREVPFYAAIGLIYSLFALSGMSSVAFDIPIAVAVALIYTQPIFTAIIAYATGKEGLTPAGLGVILVGVIGVFLLTGLDVINLQANLGMIFPILAGCFYAIYLWLKRQAYGKPEYSPCQLLFNTFLFAIPPLLVVWLVSGSFSQNVLLTGVVIPSARQLLLLFGFAAFSTVFPYSMLNYVKVDEVSPTQEGLLLLGDPLLHALWAFLFFRQHVAIMQYLGAALILGSAAFNLKLSSR